MEVIIFEKPDPGARLDFEKEGFHFIIAVKTDVFVKFV